MSANTAETAVAHGRTWCATAVSAVFVTLATAHQPARPLERAGLAVDPAGGEVVGRNVAHRLAHEELLRQLRVERRPGQPHAHLHLLLRPAQLKPPRHDPGVAVALHLNHVGRADLL